MFDLLAAIQSVDPPSLVLWSMVAFAAGMYPVGFMLGSSCSACCGCEQCQTGTLPETVTVTFDNFPERVYWVDVQISACHGSGAFARASESNPDAPYEITAVEVLHSGSGYAKLGRVSPPLTITGSGSGATFTPTLQAVNDKCGLPSWKVSSVAVSGGAGYTNAEQLTVDIAAGDTVTTPAVLTLQTERSEPSLTASATGGTGATFAVSTTSNGGSPQTWGVSGVSVSGTTSGYTDGASISFGYGAGVTEQTKATATIRTARTVPTITASAAGGSGAALAVTLSQSPTSPSDTALWHVDGVSVTDGGTGYTDGDPVTFTVTDGTQVTAASGTAVVVSERENPNLTPYVWGLYDGTPTTGTGASLSATMEPNGDEWTVASITILNGGSGYQVGEFIWWSELAEFGDNPPYYIVAVDGYWITSVDENGAITGIGLDPNIGGTGLYYKEAGNGSIASVNVTAGGDYYKATSTISRVVVTNAGAYFYDTGVPSSVTIASGGSYYREDASEPPYVAEVTATVVDRRPYTPGAGATAAAVVDDDTGSATFGQIVSVSITNDGGAGYAAWEHNRNCCGQFFNGRSVVLRRPKVSLYGDGSSFVEKCVYTHTVCSNIIHPDRPYHTNEVLVYYDGPTSPPRVRLIGAEGGRLGEMYCNASLYSDTLITDCSTMSFTASDYRGVTATVTPGGDYDPEYANQDCAAKGAICCGWDSDPPDEIEVEVRDLLDENGNTLYPGQEGGEWGPPNGLAEVPVIVLSLNGGLGATPIYGSYAFFFHGRDVIQWGGQVPGDDFVVQNLAVRVQACADCAGEQPCPSSCATTVRMQDYYYLYGDSSEWASDPCDGCAEIPQCSPAAMEFEGSYGAYKGRKVTIL